MARPLDPVTQHFVAVCEKSSIARAAAREALVASAPSKRIAALEAELGAFDQDMQGSVRVLASPWLPALRHHCR